ncbi:xanthine phosphoribosyltransferase [Buchnera aphidicola]|uniref:xanthine phosphoribosyltransferase n=1 Tax=Buchnera aphidicola TaxID=9 RepID=UPI003464C539
MKKKFIVTWERFQIYSRQLAYKLSLIKKWKKIIAVSRGGLVPAACIAQELGIRFVDTICIASYNDQKLQNDVKIIKIAKNYNQSTLIIDDLSDTGGTARIIHKIYPKSYFFTVFAKPMGCMFVNGYIVNVPQDVWVEQPWEIPEHGFFLTFRKSNYI